MSKATFKANRYVSNTLKEAKIMLADNMDEKLILKYTGISPEKLKELKSLQK